MKNWILAFALFLLGTSVGAQAPQSFKYQAVARDGSGNVLTSRNVSFKISILKGSTSGAVSYSETHKTTTNAYGLANLEIGKGTPVSGNFANINWASGSYFVKVELDPNGGSAYQNMGTSQLLSVPYALHAKTVEENDDADADPNNEIQALQLSGTQLTLSKNGGTVNLPSSGGGDNWGTDFVHSNATLSGNGTTSTPLKIAQQSAINGQVLKWNGSTWEPSFDDAGLWASNGNKIFYSGENVGIGYSNPYYTLELKNDGDVCAQKFFTSTSGTTVNDGFGISLYKSLNAEIFNYENGDILFGTNSTNRMTILANGNVYFDKKVGIGVLSPVSKLDLYDGSVCRERFFTASTGKTENDGLSICIYDGTKNAEIFNHENGEISFGTNSTYRMTILSDGNVNVFKRLLIGSYGVPAAGLELKGSGFPDSFVYIESDAGQDAGLRLYEGATAKWHIFNSSTQGGLMIYNSEATPAIFAKQSNSYVGIGTTNPTYPLHVNGDAAKTSGTTAWVISSDRRLKNILGNYEKGLDEITALQPIKFKYKEDNPRNLPTNTELVGFIAQDVQKVFPEAVNQGEDGYLDFQYTLH